jgi:ABC-type transport system involved in cytochrome c biogenesis permease component
MSLAHSTATILAKELRTEFRSRELLGTTVVFVLIVIVLFSFALDSVSFRRIAHVAAVLPARAGQ